MDRHYHIWYYVRSPDGTINTLRRDPMEFETRRKAVYALEGPKSRSPMPRWLRRN